MLTPQEIQAIRKKYNYTPKSAVGLQPLKKTSNLTLPEKTLSTIGNVSVGVGKGLLSTFTGMSSLGQRLIINPATKLGGGKVESKTAAEKLIPEKLRKPEGTAQNIGFYGEQIAEFLLPGSSSLKAGKALATTVKSAKLAGVVKVAGVSATEALISGGQTAIQEGKIGKSSLASGATALAISPTLIGINKILNKAPQTLWGQILDRTAKMVEKNPNLERQISEKGIVGTRKQINKIAQNNIQLIENQLDDLLSGSNKTIKGKNVAGYLDGLKESYKVIPGESNSIEIISNLQKEMIGKGKISAQEANIMKRNIYQLIANSYGKGILDIPAKKEAQKVIASGLRQEIEKIIPEAKSLNEKQAIFIQTKKAIDRVINQPRKGIAGTGVGMYDLILGGAVSATGGLPLAVKAMVGKKVAESAFIRSRSSKLLQYFDRLSPTKKVLFMKALNGFTSFGWQQGLK